MNPIERYYDSDPKKEWERLERHQTEFAITCRVLREFLPRPPAKILDVGGGPGRYAIHLARLGYGVKLLDLSRANLEFAQQQASQVGVQLQGFYHCNGLALPTFSSVSADVVLLLGPLYHLLELHEQQQALAEAYRVLRSGGILFAAFITRFAFLRDIAANEPEYVEQNPDYTEYVLSTGRHDSRFIGGFTRAYFARPEEITPLAEGVGFHTLRLQGCEGVVSQHEDKINQLTGNDFERWADFNYRVGQEPSLWGASDHLLYVGKKP